MKRIFVRFFCSTSGNEPVREWLKGLCKEDMTIIGEDIKTVEYGWPLGMPLVRKIKIYGKYVLILRIRK